MKGDGHISSRLLRRRIAQWFAGPLAAGSILATAVVTDAQSNRPVVCVAAGLFLLPAVLVQCHVDDRGLTWLQTTILSVACAILAYAIMVLGLIAGATLMLTIVFAAQSGVLAAIAQVCGVVGLAHNLTRRNAA